MNPEFKIVEFANPSGGKVFRVTGWLDGKRIRQNFPNSEEALSAKQNFEREALNLVPLPAVTTRLSTDQISDTEFCLKLIEGKKLTLRSAVEFAVKNFVFVDKVCTVKDALEKFIADKKTSRAGGVAEATERKYRERLKLLVDTHGDKNLNEILPEHLEPLIFRAGSGDVNRHTDRTNLVNFFNWAVFREFCVSNPLDKIRKIKLDYGEPVVLTLAQARLLIHHAETFQGGAWLPFTVLALFCGMRVKEIARFEQFGGWDNFQLGEPDKKGRETATLTLGPKICKGRSRRMIKLDAVAIAYILPFVMDKSAIILPNMRRRLQALRKLAGLGEWKQDLLRHTAITYKLAALNADASSESWAESQTAEWAGNSPAIIHKHYRGMIRVQGDVQKFWDIRKGQCAQIIQLNQKAA